MTYCVGMLLQEGLLFASDSRTNAGVDHISTFRKMHIFQNGKDRRVVIVSAGNLATTQSVISQLQKDIRQDHEEHILSLPSLYDIVTRVGQTVREVISRDSGQQAQGLAVDFSCNLIVGGQVRGEAPRLFNVYAQGNFIEATADTPYFQIGEIKYGKPILDRVVKHDTSLADGVKLVLISMDSTLRSNLSVGLPIDLMVYREGEQKVSLSRRITEEDAYFRQVSQRWSDSLREAYRALPSPGWIAD